MTQMVWFLLTVALLFINAAELVLIRKLEREFQADHGHSMRDIADRIETMLLSAGTSAQTVASNLATAQTAVDNVALDLAASHGRADATHGPPGEASDAASRSL